jgi:RsiW-degrading membrane proteinase PrsW (M82 family)
MTPLKIVVGSFSLGIFFLKIQAFNYSFFGNPNQIMG